MHLGCAAAANGDAFGPGKSNNGSRNVMKLISLFQYCSDPECSSGALFDRYACQCSSFTKSTCPDGTSPIVNPNGQCSCQEVVHPKCYEGYTLNPDDCVCKTSVVPDCPKNTYLWPRNARCVGTDDPYCPKGFTKVGCKCVRDDERVCESGKLTANYCKCKNVYPPTCTGDGCSLNTNGQCTCERDGGKCGSAHTT